ncbi:signal peptidase I [Desulfosediminicola flagellatus]|uniref:signal peptidase I n=1 Tax=Desulfosediminicola flagellatus TaxID=2569541 RepID=UPI001C3DBB76|nr:signal peptidase I [Desulfosediminicola flagellatus]
MSSEKFEEGPHEMMNDPRNNTKNTLLEKISSVWRGWGVSFVIAILIATSFKSAIADWNDVPTGSMKPTILIGDRVFVNKLAYDLKIPYTTIHLAKWSDPKRGDIVVFYSPEDGTRMIKRVVGIPGDTVGLRQNRLFVNGQFLNYERVKGIASDEAGESGQQSFRIFQEDLTGISHTVQFLPSQPPQATFNPIVLPEGQYFMMGDNRDNSADSRFFGLVDRTLIVGQATKIVISRDGSFLHPRWNRILAELI